METPTAVESPLSFQKIPVEKIQPSPYQPRKDFTPEDLQDLADSMKEEGLLQPVLVRPSHDSFQLVSGERRRFAEGGTQTQRQRSGNPRPAGALAIRALAVVRARCR